MSLQDFTRGYIDAAFFTSLDESAPLDDNYSASDLSDEARAIMERDCITFYGAHGWRIVEQDDYQGGIDFWLTRNGHGAGYWDGDYPEHGDALDAACNDYGDVDLYVGDDQQVHHFPHA